MMMKESLFALTSNVLGREYGAGRGPNRANTYDDGGFFVSADCKCFREGAQ